VRKTVARQLLEPGGVTTTLKPTGEQWDSPNGWAPLEYMTIEGLNRYGYKTLAKEIATRWIKLNIKVYRNTGKLMEKYNVENMTLRAGGGEYGLQDGFGWTNGVLLKLMDAYNIKQ
jgi:alpha,alpha-trehalase